MENETKIKLLEKSLELNHGLRNAFDYKANFFLAISGLIMSLAIAADNKLVVIFSALAAIFSILAINNYHFNKVNQTGIVCWWGIKDKSFKEYKEAIDKIKNEEDLINEYEKEIYSLYKNSLKNKIFFIRIATFLLITAFIISLLKNI